MFEIAKITIKEFVRMKLLYIGIILAIFFMLFSYLLDGLTINQGEKVIVDFNLFVIEIFSLLLTLFLGAWILYNEFSRKTILIILSKLKHKYYFIIGKFIGFSFILFLIYLILTIGFVISLFLHGLKIELFYFQALFLSYLKILIVLSFVLFFSTFVGPFLSLISSLAIYVFSHSSSFVYFFVITDNNNYFSPVIKKLTKFFYYILPNFQDLSMKEYFLSPYLTNYTNGHFLLSIFGGALSYMFILLLLASIIFNRKEF